MVSVYFYTLFYFEERRFKKYIKLKKFIETDKKSVFYLRKEIFMFKEATIQGKISGPVMIVSVTQKQTRTSKPYLILKLRDDQKKEVDAKLWNMSVEEFPFDKNTVIIGEFSVGEYNGQKDFTLDMYREALESEYRMEDFINAAPYSPQKMYEYILQIADQTVLDDDYLAIIHNIYEKYKEQIFIWSAAKAVHHNIRSGFLYHTFRMVQSGIALGKVYGQALNHSLLLTGIILHDVGKLKELYTDPTGNADYTPEGSLLGHLLIGCEMIDEACNKLDLQNDENKDKILLLKHLLASHHGKQEYGAITVPQLPEAIMLNRIDMIDAEMYQCEHALEDQSNGTFTDRIFGINNTRLYKPL